MALAGDPAIADFHIGALDRGPRDPMRGFFLTRVSGMGREGVVEGGTKASLTRKIANCSGSRKPQPNLGRHPPLARRVRRRDRADAVMAPLPLPDAGLHKDVPCAVPTFGINCRTRTRTRAGQTEQLMWGG